MTAEMIGTLVDKGIMLIAGVYFTLLGFRLVGRKPGIDENYDLKMNKVSTLFKVCGPSLIAISLLLIGNKLINH